MTLLASHFAIVLGAWRLRVRIDIDEPSEGHVCDDAAEAASASAARAGEEQRRVGGYVPFGRG